MQLLRTYGARELEEREANTLRTIIEFIRAHPDGLSRTCIPGHLTGSAWVVNPDRTRTLLTHHRKHSTSGCSWVATLTEIPISSRWRCERPGKRAG